MIDLNYNNLFMDKNNLIKLLIFHNTLAEYRVGFFNELNKICELMIVFTDYDIGDKIYKNKIDVMKIEFKFDIISGSKKDKIKNCIDKVNTLNPDCIIIPTLDDLNSVTLGRKLVEYGHSKGIKVGLFWEKWCWNYSDMTLLRRIKEFVQKILVSPIIKECDLLMAPGRKTAEYLRACGAKDSKIFKIHDASEVMCANNENIHRKYSIEDNNKIILFLGRIVYIKGLDNLIRAVALLPDEYKKTHTLLVCGDGPERQNCERLCLKYNLNNVIFTGTIPPSERGPYFKQSNVFVLPSRAFNGRTDAWGLSLNEALQFKKVLISTTAVGAAYELINNKNGFVVMENSVSELSTALIEADAKELEMSAEIEDGELFNLYNYKNMAKDIIDAIVGKGSCIL